MMKNLNNQSWKNVWVCMYFQTLIILGMQIGTQTQEPLGNINQNFIYTHL